ncbi:DarT ssDNA thymidine ADP-ribosyltransferase family protein [Acaryochloris sp. IP29b_bin.137]|uniref:DarT ssDNA thymidine ADP-ribosyltransferase family protein n=1 Tax=Acaryochloris sp. IP29b_bin.137 TaxID=2969217 RepID=UPI00260A643A|nr:DarT ssDNA thymidine ADP-ribosyltransferase family protein [Acaryochloris sp. IP29b_bin.137]
MKSKWIALGGLSFSISFCLSIPINKNLEKSLLMGLGTSASTVASVAILSKLNKIDEHIYRSRVALAEQQKDLEAQLARLQTDKASAGESLAIVVEQLDKKNEAYSHISDRNKQLESDKEDLESLINQYSSELEDISCLIEEGNEEIDQLDQKKSDIEQSVKDLNHQQTCYEQSVKENRSALKQLETEVSALEDQRGRLLSDCEGLNEEIRYIEQTRADLNTSISDLERQLSQMDSEEKHLQECINTLSSQTTVKEAEVNNLEIEISELNQKIVEGKKKPFSSLDLVYIGNTELDERQQAIRKICEERNIDICTHYTRVEHLSSILSKGLIPRKKLHEYGIELACSSNNKIERQRLGNCLSISHPSNDPFKSSSSNSKKKWVILSYRKEILWELDCEFYAQNGADEISALIPEEHRNTAMALSNMFFDGTSHYTQDVKAEVLVFNMIPSFYLKEVTFYDSESLKEWINDKSCFRFNHDLFGLRDTIPGGCETPAEVQKTDLY